MPDYLAPFLEQLSHGAQVIQHLKDQALQQDQIKFERAQQLRQNEIQDRQLANADIGNLQHLRESARPVDEGGNTSAVSARTPFFDPVTGADTGAGSMTTPQAFKADPERVVSYRTQDGKLRNFELMTPEEIAQKRMSELRAATEIKMLPTIFTQQQENLRADKREAGEDRRTGMKEAGLDRRQGNDLDFKDTEGKRDRALKEQIAAEAARARLDSARIAASSREKAAGISADARRDAAAMGAKAGLSAAQVAVQGRFDEGLARTYEKQAQDAEAELNQLHAKKLAAGQAKYKSDKWGDPAKSREAVLAGLEGQIKAAEAKRSHAQQNYEAVKARMTGGGGQPQQPAQPQQQSPAAQSAGPKVASLDKVKEYAAKKGITIDEAVRQARASGWQVK